MEILATILTLICVFLTVRSHILCWPFSMFASLTYMYVFVEQHIYFQAGLQVVFILQSIYGWVYWNKNKVIRIPESSWIKLIIHLTIILLLTIVLSVSLRNKTDNPQLVLDILTVLLSLLGTWYLAVKNVFGWLVWVIADAFFVIMFMNQQMYWSTGLYLILLGLAIKGLITWTKNITTD